MSLTSKMLYGISPGVWDKFNLDSMLCEGDQLFKFIGKIRYLGMDDLPQKLLVENSSMEFLENKTGETTAGAYLISILKVVNSAQQFGTGPLLILRNYLGR